MLLNLTIPPSIDQAVLIDLSRREDLQLGFGCLVERYDLDQQEVLGSELKRILDQYGIGPHQDSLAIYLASTVAQYLKSTINQIDLTVLLLILSLIEHQSQALELYYWSHWARTAMILGLQQPIIGAGKEDERGILRTVLTPLMGGMNSHPLLSQITLISPEGFGCLLMTLILCFNNPLEEIRDCPGAEATLGRYLPSATRYLTLEEELAARHNWEALATFGWLHGGRPLYLVTNNNTSPSEGHGLPGSRFILVPFEPTSSSSSPDKEEPLRYLEGYSRFGSLTGKVIPNLVGTLTLTKGRQDSVYKGALLELPNNQMLVPLETVVASLLDEMARSIVKEDEHGSSLPFNQASQLLVQLVEIFCLIFNRNWISLQLNGIHGFYVQMGSDGLYRLWYIPFGLSQADSSKMPQDMKAFCRAWVLQIHQELNKRLYFRQRTFHLASAIHDRSKRSIMPNALVNANLFSNRYFCEELYNHLMTVLRDNKGQLCPGPQLREADSFASSKPYLKLRNLGDLYLPPQRTLPTIKSLPVKQQPVDTNFNRGQAVTQFTAAAAAVTPGNQGPLSKFKKMGILNK